MKKYNNELFWMGFLMNIVGKIPLLLISVVCGIIGFWIQPCLFVAIGLLILIVAWSLIQQIQIKHAVETSDNPNFTPFANAMMSDNWREEMQELIENNINKE